MPGPVSNGIMQIPFGDLTRQNIRSNGKTEKDFRSGKSARRMANKARCEIRNAGGKFRGTAHNCQAHPQKG